MDYPRAPLEGPSVAEVTPLVVSPVAAGAQSKPSSPAGVRPGATAAPRVEFIAVSDDDGLLEQLGQTLDGDSAIRQADTIDAARELISAAQPCIVLLDVRSHENAGAVMEQLQSPTELSVIVVFAAADQTSAIASSIRNSAAFAVLPVPIELAKTAAVLEGAREEVLSRRDIAEAPPAPTTRHEPVPGPAASQDPHAGAAVARDTHVAGAASHAGAAPSPSARPASKVPRPVLVGGLGILACVVAIAAWSVLRGGGHESVTSESGRAGPDVANPTGGHASPAVIGDAQPRPTSSPSAPLPIKSGAVDDLLDQARAAFSERRYTDPKGESALVYYKSVLAQEPDNGEALEGLSRIAGVLDERLDAAVAEGRVDDATVALGQLKLVETDTARLRKSEAKIAGAQISSALNARNFDRAAALLRQAESTALLTPEQLARYRADLERRQSDARMDDLAELVATRIREGRLVDPASDSAQYYLAQLRKVPGSAQRSAAAARDLNAALRDRTRRDARAANQAAAAAASETDRLAQLVRDRISDGRLLEPVQDSALYHLGALRAADASGASYASSASALSTRLLADGQAALAAGKLDAAQADAVAARQIGLSLSEVESLERGVASARSPAVHAPVPVTADQLKRTRYVAPEYPGDAVRKNLEGSVRVKFTVGTDGKVTEAAIVQATPERVFDRAALAAVRRWRFEPVVIGGAVTEATMETTVTFRIDAEAAR